jgi:hypothetical protein
MQCSGTTQGVSPGPTRAPTQRAQLGTESRCVVVSVWAQAKFVAMLYQLKYRVVGNKPAKETTRFLPHRPYCSSALSCNKTPESYGDRPRCCPSASGCPAPDDPNCQGKLELEDNLRKTVQDAPFHPSMLTLVGVAKERHTQDRPPPK